MIRAKGLLVRIFCQWMAGKGIVGERLVGSLLNEISGLLILAALRSSIMARAFRSAAWRPFCV